MKHLIYKEEAPTDAQDIPGRRSFSSVRETGLKKLFHKLFLIGPLIPQGSNVNTMVAQLLGCTYHSAHYVAAKKQHP